MQAYYRALEQIDGLRHTVQFPKLESPPGDFLEQMEGYVRDAPRHVSENGVPQAKKVWRAQCMQKKERRTDAQHPECEELDKVVTADGEKYVPFFREAPAYEVQL